MLAPKRDQFNAFAQKLIELIVVSNGHLEVPGGSAKGINFTAARFSVARSEFPARRDENTNGKCINMEETASAYQEIQGGTAKFCFSSNWEPTCQSISHCNHFEMILG